MRLGKGWILLAAVSAALTVVGCGGGGGASGSASTQIFAQDDTNKSFSHVWVTIDKLTLSNGTSTTTVFDDTATGGRVVDLRSLWNDQTNAPQYLLLGQTDTSAAPYTSVGVTLEPVVSVVGTGSTTSVGANLGGANAPITLSLNLPAGSQSGSIVVDFNLSKWTLNGSTLSAPAGQYIAVGTKSGLGNGSQHANYQYMGKISNLSGTAPNQTFTLEDGLHSVGTVDMSSSTVVYNIGGTPSPVLADGDLVLVAGSYDPTASAIKATNVEILPPATKATVPHVMGVVTADDAAGGTLTVQPGFAFGFLPQSTSTTVTVSSSTTFIDGSGVTDTEAEFFAAITPGTTQVVASGTLTGGSLQATTVKIIGSSPAAAEVALMGSPSNVDAAAGTFDLSVRQWQGLWFKGTTVIHVTTSTDTKFTAGDSTGASAFFTAVRSTGSVFVRGNLDSTTNTLAATIVATGSNFGG